MEAQYGPKTPIESLVTTCDSSSIIENVKRAEANKDEYTFSLTEDSTRNAFPPPPRKHVPVPLIIAADGMEWNCPTFETWASREVAFS